MTLNVSLSRRVSRLGLVGVGKVDDPLQGSVGSPHTRWPLDLNIGRRCRATPWRSGCTGHQTGVGGVGE